MALVGGLAFHLLKRPCQSLVEAGSGSKSGSTGLRLV